MRELHLFAGAGGGILGGMLLGHACVCAVEIEPYCRRVLLQRQREGVLPRFPIWDDISTFDGRPWRRRVDVVCGGFPCQDISVAGRGRGIDGTRSGLWAEMARVVREVGPAYVFVENSPMLVARGLGRVLGDLASVGYDAEWDVFSAAGVGAPHLRRRLWILAHTKRPERWTTSSGQCGDSRQLDSDGLCGRSEDPSRAGASCAVVANPEKQHGAIDGREASEPGWCGEDVSHTSRDGRKQRRAEPEGRQGGSEVVECGTSGHAYSPRLAQRQGQPGDDGAQQSPAERAGWWQSEPGMGRVADGVADRLDLHGLTADESIPRVAVGVRDRVKRLRATGNGQVPAVAARAFTELLRRIE